MADTIKIRRDIEANWNAVASTCILAEGEIGIITDKQPLQCKVGNGTTNWANLQTQAWVGPESINELSGLLDELSGSLTTLVSSSYSDLSGQIRELSGSLEDNSATLQANTSYIVCSTASGSAAKVVNLPDFELSTHCRLVVRMAEKNVAASPTLNVNSTGAVPLWFNGALASADNSWSDGDTLDIYHDGTVYNSVLLKEPKFSSGQPVIDVKIKDETGEEVQGTADVLSAEAGANLKIVYDSLTECDLDIRDEHGYALAVLSGGDIRTKNFDSANTPSIKNNYTSDLDVEDESGNILARFADGNISTKNFESRRVRMFSYGENRVSFQYPVDCQRSDTDDWQTATVVNEYTQQVLYTDNAVLYLPESYSPNGTPTRLIIYCKHGASTVEPGSDYILSNSGDGNIFHFLLKLGYAVLAADGVPNDYAAAIGITERVVGNYIAIQSTRNAYNHVVKNYNIADDGVFVYGWSQGGMYAQNVADLCGFNVLAVAELSPVCSYQWHQWDLVAPVTIGGVTWQKSARLNIARLFNFPTVNTNAELDALTFDETKVIGYDPWTRNAENPFMGFEKQNGLWRLPSNINLDDITMKKHLSAPLKIWCANNDPVLGVDVMKVFIKAAKNAGCIADLHLMTSGGHNINSAQSAIGTFNYKGSTYNLYPLAYEIARWFRDFGGLEFTV